MDPRYLLRWVSLFAGMPTASPCPSRFCARHEGAFEKKSPPKIIAKWLLVSDQVCLI
jgi:hypothetical protein